MTEIIVMITYKTETRPGLLAELFAKFPDDDIDVELRDVPTND